MLGQKSTYVVNRLGQKSREPKNSIGHKHNRYSQVKNRQREEEHEKRHYSDLEKNHISGDNHRYG